MPVRNITISEKWFLDVDELTDNSTGTADGTVEPMPDVQAAPAGATAAELAAINNNFAELTEKINSLLDRMKADV